MKITEKKYFQEYWKKIGKQIPDLIDKFNSSKSENNFDYLTKSSAVYSANIEGNSIDLHSFMNYELSKKSLIKEKKSKKSSN